MTVPGGNALHGIDVLKPSGSLDVHGTVLGPTWTRLRETAAAGGRALRLQEAVRWAPGDRIVLTSTFWQDEIQNQNQNEVLTVANVTDGGRTVNVVEAARFNHYGGPEYQAEVGLLTRRVVFTSDSAGAATLLGPHTTAFTANARVEGAAFERWGARNQPGKYPVHFHLVGDTQGAAYVKGCSFYDTYWRCLSIHATNGVTVSGNVGFNSELPC